MNFILFILLLFLVASFLFFIQFFHFFIPHFIYKIYFLLLFLNLNFQDISLANLYLIFILNFLDKFICFRLKFDYYIFLFLLINICEDLLAILFQIQLKSMGFLFFKLLQYFHIIDYLNYKRFKFISKCQMFNCLICLNFNYYFKYENQSSMI